MSFAKLNYNFMENIEKLYEQILGTLSEMICTSTAAMAPYPSPVVGSVSIKSKKNKDIKIKKATMEAFEGEKQTRGSQKNAMYKFNHLKSRHSRKMNLQETMNEIAAFCNLILREDEIEGARRRKLNRLEKIGKSLEKKTQKAENEYKKAEGETQKAWNILAPRAGQIEQAQAQGKEISKPLKDRFHRTYNDLQKAKAQQEEARKNMWKASDKEKANSKLWLQIKGAKLGEAQEETYPDKFREFMARHKAVSTYMKNHPNTKSKIVAKELANHLKQLKASAEEVKNYNK